MAKLTLKKALAMGIVALPKLTMRAMMAMQAAGAWVSDERKL